MYVNLFLRLLSVVFKFAMMILAPKYMPTSDYVTLVVLIAASALITTLCGLEFYTYSLKSFFEHDKPNIKNIIMNSSALYIASYIVIIPISLYSYGNYVEWSGGSLLLGAIFILEHLTTEISRILIFLQRQHRATIVLILKSGLWSILLIFYLTSPLQYSMRTILLIWLFSLGLSLFSGLLFLKLQELKNDWGRLSNKWIKRGFYPAMKMLAYSASFLIIFSYDKVFVKEYASVDFGVAYIFFFSFYSFTLTILDATAISYYLPKLLSLKASSSALDTEAHKFSRLVIQISLISILSVSGISLLAIELLNYSQYLNYTYLMPIMAISFLLYNIATYPQIKLYIANKEGILALLNIFAMLMYISITHFSTPLLGEIAIPLTMLLSFSFLYLGRIYFVKKLSL